MTVERQEFSDKSKEIEELNELLLNSEELNKLLLNLENNRDNNDLGLEFDQISNFFLI